MFTCNAFSQCPSLIYQALIMTVIAGALIPTIVLFINEFRGKDFLGTWKKQPKLFVIQKLEHEPRVVSKAQNLDKKYKKAA